MTAKQRPLTKASLPCLAIYLLCMCWSVFAPGANATPQLSIIKDASSNIVTDGQQLIYLLEIANSGTSAADNVTVADALTEQVVFDAATGGGSFDTGTQTVNWSFPSIGPGQTLQLSIITTVDAAPLEDWSNTATVSFGSSPGTVITSNTVNVINLNAPELAVSKTVNSSNANVGDTLIYTLNYSNAGPSSATNVTLIDRLPPNSFEPSSIVATDGGTVSGNEVEWVLPDLAPGQSGAVSVSANIALVPDMTDIQNQAELTSTDADQAILSNIVTTTVRSETSLSAEATSAPNSPGPGDVVQFTTEITNQTATPAENIVVLARIPQNTTYQSNLGGGTFSANAVTWNIGTLGPKQSTSVALSVELSDSLINGDSIEFEAGVTLSNGPQEGAGLIIFVSDEPALNLVKTASRTLVSAGQEITYTLDYSNTGSDAPDAVLIDYLPTQTRFDSATGGGVQVGNTVRWNLGKLDRNASGSVSVVVSAADPIRSGSILKNVAELNAELGLPVTDSANVIVSDLPQLTVMKAADVAIVAPGGEITYSITFENTGASIADGVVVADIIPVGTRFRRCSANCGQEVGARTWQVGSLPPGQDASVTLTVVVDPMATNGTVISNNASIKSNNSPTALSPLVETLVVSDGVKPRPASINTLPAMFMLLLMVCTGYIGARAERQSDSRDRSSEQVP